MGKLLYMFLIGFLCVASTYSQSYDLSPAYNDPYLTQDHGGGHDFWVNNPGGLFYGYNNWNFVDNTGKLVINGEQLQITGRIHPLANYSACQYYDVNIIFKKSEGENMPKKELADSAYVPNGPINPETWKFYSFVSGYWSGSGCNSKDRIQFTGAEGNMPLQLGVGANGKNGQNGVSVWLLYGYVIVDINCDIKPTPTQPPTIAPTQPPTIAPTQPPTQAPCSCDKVQCPPGFHCEIDYKQNVAKCVCDTTEPPTIAPTYPPTQPPTQAPCSCDKVKCPPGFHCEIDYKQNVAICVCDTTEPPTIAPTQPPTQAPCSCDKVHCPPGFHCEIDYEQNVAKCVCDTTEPPTIAPTYPPTQPPTQAPCSCDKVQCPPGFHCEIDYKQNVAKCVCDTTEPPVLDCSTLKCPPGYHCESYGGKRKCVCDTTEPPTIAPTNPPRPPCSCDRVQCPRGYHCEVDRWANVARCVENDPRPRPTHRPHHPRGCRPDSCKRGEKCICIHGKVYCIPKTTCEQVRCPRKFHCESNRKGQLFCVPDCPKLKCHQIGCPENHKCVERRGHLHCIYVKPRLGFYNDNIRPLGYNEDSVADAIDQYERARDYGIYPRGPSSQNLADLGYNQDSVEQAIDNYIDRQNNGARANNNNNRNNNNNGVRANNNNNRNNNNNNNGAELLDGVQLGFGDGGFDLDLGF